MFSVGCTDDVCLWKLLNKWKYIRILCVCATVLSNIFFSMVRKMMSYHYVVVLDLHHSSMISVHSLTLNFFNDTCNHVVAIDQNVDFLRVIL